MQAHTSTNFVRRQHGTANGVPPTNECSMSGPAMAILCDDFFACLPVSSKRLFHPPRSPQTKKFVFVNTLSLLASLPGLILFDSMHFDGTD